VNKSLEDLQALRDVLIKNVSREAGKALKTLLEEKHIYQQVAIDVKGLIAAWVAKVKPLGVMEDEDEFDNEHFSLSDRQLARVERGVPVEVPVLTLIVENPKLFCSPCGEREVFRPVWYRDVLNELRTSVPFRATQDANDAVDGLQLFYLTFQCQRCLGKPEGFVVRRAAEYAVSVGIDLREVHEVAPEMFSWLGIRVVRSQEEHLFMHDGHLGFGHVGSEELIAALKAAVGETRKDAPLLRSTETGAIISVLDAFVGAVRENPSLWDGVLPNSPAKRVQIRIEYPRDDSHFVVDTTAGPVRVLYIDFDGELSLRELEAPISRVTEYRHVGKDQTVAQTAGFTMPMPIHGQRVALELHHLSGTGALHMSIRHLGKATRDDRHPPPGTPAEPSSGGGKLT